VRRSAQIEAIVLGGLAAALLGALGAYAFVKSGIFNAGASSPHTKFTEWITHETMIHSVRRHARAIAVPDRFPASAVIAGFCAYQAHCVACHGAAGVARQPWANGMEPQPPYLLDATRDWSPQELFWIAKNGIKMTGMPAWGNAMTDGQIWTIVAWLEASSKMPPQTYVRWSSARNCGEPASMPR